MCVKLIIRKSSEPVVLLPGTTTMHMMWLPTFTSNVILIGILSVYPLHSAAFNTTLQANNGTTACSLLQQELGTTIVQSSGSAQYDAGVAHAYNLFNGVIEPSCIVFPSAPADVQTAMRAIVSTGSKYAVQAGGHTGMIGWNKCAFYSNSHFLADLSFIFVRTVLDYAVSRVEF
jgi:hypothetical protein